MKAKTANAPLPPLKGRSPTAKQKLFAAKYAETLNATEAALTAYGAEDRNTARSIGSENLRKPAVREEIAALMAGSGIDMQDVVSIHRRNLLQDKHLPTSQKAVSDFYQLAGLTEKQDAPDIRIAFVIEK